MCRRNYHKFDITGAGVREIYDGCTVWITRTATRFHSSFGRDVFILSSKSLTANKQQYTRRHGRRRTKERRVRWNHRDIIYLLLDTPRENGRDGKMCIWKKNKPSRGEQQRKEICVWKRNAAKSWHDSATLDFRDVTAAAAAAAGGTAEWAVSWLNGLGER